MENSSEPETFRDRSVLSRSDQQTTWQRVVSTDSDRSGQTTNNEAQKNTAAVVTPQKRRNDGQDINGRSIFPHGARSTKRRLSFLHHDNQEMEVHDSTQPFEMSQSSNVLIDDNTTTTIKYRLVEYVTQMAIEIPTDCSRGDFTIGRDCKDSIVKIPSSRENFISRKHCKLVYDDLSQSFYIKPLDGQVFITKDGKWSLLDKDTERPIGPDTPFRLVPFNEKRGTRQWDQFVLEYCSALSSASLKPGSESFDYQYLDLLRLLKEQGIKQHNKKGSSVTLPVPFEFKINLFHPSKKLLPTTTLRKIMGGGVHAVYEAVWYLRGEDHVKFLQRLGNKFWDKQAGPDSFVGLSYGLITNYGDDGKNQLFSNVIQQLSDGKCSRNMTVILEKPGEETVQKACTSSIQFSVEPPMKVGCPERLNLTVNQRSSDLILGLPHDVIAWSTILHLVCDEVKGRTPHIERKCIIPGSLYFHIAAGGAHVYCKNESAWHEILRREPKNKVEVELRIMQKKEIFCFAQEFEKKDVRIVGYDDYHGRMVIQQAV